MDFALVGNIDADDPYGAISDWLAAAPACVTFDALEDTATGDSYEVETLGTRAVWRRPVGLRERIERASALRAAS